jgi:hypothetical protein
MKEFKKLDKGNIEDIIALHQLSRKNKKLVEISVIHVLNKKRR